MKYDKGSYLLVTRSTEGRVTGEKLISFLISSILHFVWVLDHAKNNPTGPEETDESIHYEGGKNEIVLAQDFQFEHNCIFDLLEYPFDVQLCPMKVNIGLHLNFKASHEHTVGYTKSHYQESKGQSVFVQGCFLS